MTKQEAQKAKVQELSEMLAEGVAELRTSEDWQAMLAVQARFHRYSFANVMLISIQSPEASQVAGYRKWQDMGRQVRKGETAIKIFAPRIVKVEDEETGEKVRRLVGFLAVNVFDISQTDGDDVPNVSDFLIEIEEDAPVGGIEMVQNLVEKNGFTFEIGEVNHGDATGVTRYASSEVIVQADQPAAQTFKTAVHELAHVELHAPGGERPECRGSVEVEAESVAFIVSAALGLPTQDYSFGYVAAWAERANDPKAVEASMRRVQKAAAEILGAF